MDLWRGILRGGRMQKVFQPDLFDVDAVLEMNQEFLQKKEQEARQAFYDTVELPYFENPQNDSEKLFSLQYKYLKERDEKARQDLYILAYEIMKRILWARMKKGGLGWLDEEQQNEIVGDAFLYVFRRYERGIGYTVNKSFISVLKCGVKHALEYTTMKDKEQSLTGIKNITKKARALYN
jgi:hypothetical protein